MDEQPDDVINRVVLVVAASMTLAVAGCSGSESTRSAVPTTRGDAAMEIDGWAVYEQLVETPWTELTEAQQHLVSFGDLRSELNNGGFDQYFFNSAGDHAATAADAARIAGLDSLAGLVLRAMQSIPGGYTANRDQRQGALEELDSDAFSALDDEFLDIEANADFDGAMAMLAGRP